MFKRRRLKEGPVCRKLQHKMGLVLSDLEKLATRIRKGQRLPHASLDAPEFGPIRVEDTGTIFRTPLHDGILRYEFFHYTDFQTMEPDAQVHLMEMFGDILDLNRAVAAVADKAKDERRLEAIKVLIDDCAGQAVYFQAFASRFDLSTLILERALDEEGIARHLAKLEAADAQRIKQLENLAFDFGSALAAWPRSEVPFPLIISKPYEVGQQDINGVYFDRDRAARVMAYLTLGQSLPAQSRSA